MNSYFLADKLHNDGNLTDNEFLKILYETDSKFNDYLAELARKKRENYYGKDVYVRGLTEFTNYCKNNCYYCGIRRGNKNARRYRLTKEEILSCVRMGHGLGFRTFVLQGGEDPYFTDEILTDIVKSVKNLCPDSAVTLSVGEREFESYEKLFKAGADSYLLRHETADADHYAMLHPADMDFYNRIKCLKNLKQIGYQVGAGMMIGSPFQTKEHLLKDIRFLQELKPEMVGIGPFIPHRDTDFKAKAAGALSDVLKLLSITRLILPACLLPATTALGTIHPKGREMGILAGANVVMPNLSPKGVRGKYLLYDNKICTGDEAAECVNCMKNRMANIGYNVVVSRGDYFGWGKNVTIHG